MAGRLTRWGARPQIEVQPAPMMTGRSSVPEGQRVYAIGDIHGRFDLALPLFETIRAEVAALTSPVETTVIVLGDVIDRGPQSREVVELMCDMQDEPLFCLCGLKGNHEAMFLAALDRPGTSWDKWLAFGGSATLASYGIRGVQPRSYLLRALIARHMPVEHLLYLQGLRNSLSIGDYFFCHAGARPGLALSEQKPADLMWIGDEFSTGDHAFEKVIVHGHARVAAPEIRRHSINLDTGAHVSGLLTAVVLEGTGIRFLHSRVKQDYGP